VLSLSSLCALSPGRLVDLCPGHRKIGNHRAEFFSLFNEISHFYFLKSSLSCQWKSSLVFNSIIVALVFFFYFYSCNGIKYLYKCFLGYWFYGVSNYTKQSLNCISCMHFLEFLELFHNHILWINLLHCYLLLCTQWPKIVFSLLHIQLDALFKYIYI